MCCCTRKTVLQLFRISQKLNPTRVCWLLLIITCRQHRRRGFAVRPLTIATKPIPRFSSIKPPQPASSRHFTTSDEPKSAPHKSNRPMRTRQQRIRKLHTVLQFITWQPRLLITVLKLNGRQQLHFEAAGAVDEFELSITCYGLVCHRVDRWNWRLPWTVKTRRRQLRCCLWHTRGEVTTVNRKHKTMPPRCRHT